MSYENSAYAVQACGVDHHIDEVGLDEEEGGEGDLPRSGQMTGVVSVRARETPFASPRVSP